MGQAAAACAGPRPPAAPAAAAPAAGCSPSPACMPKRPAAMFCSARTTGSECWEGPQGGKQ